MKLVTLMLGSLLVSGAVQATEPVLRIATDGTFPPYSMVKPDGSLAGFDVDIANALCSEMKAKCKIVQYDFDGMIPALKARKFDAIVASMAITEERKKAVAFSDKYEGGYSSFMGPKGTTLSGEPDAMKGQKIGVQMGSIQENYARDIYGKAGASVVTYGSPEQAWLDLQAGRLNAIVVEIGVGVEFKKREGAAGFDFFGPRMDDPDYFGVGSGIAVRHQDEALLARINGALKTILANGTYKQINDKYFDYDQYE
ncbi:transporter substrate-binding domain-containing protein [Aeromonas schubertii]|uniref:Transporter substrate-binding domain-containing protein n=5 Tax=Aeromonadaceae TaxID=84642 RepID=A0ABS7VAG1_9GAMM|nr:transporter substrate-binding domain-containing protein [Aeromonas schubertii]MBZ6066385.1 transporter substrate-binding domain-containing protein [Aeromonas schubertii]MBZ6072866.1 transporter substrate-binding domain-containing protein [Aeromonas schubertii]QCG47035.1 transporter substrate-binding domain-containing protein [Aeromonas schubertii]